MSARVAVPTPIGILCGGFSAEREISLRSGRAVWQALSALGYDVRLMDIVRADCQSMLRTSAVRTAFIALHGPFGEDGQIQGILESLGVAYTGSGIQASQLAMDKIMAREWLTAQGVAVARGSGGQAWEASLAAAGGRLPVVVKPARQGSSIGLTIVRRAAEWAAAIAEAAKYDARILCEEYLQGPELTVGILEDRPLPIVQVVPQRPFYDYVAKYTPGMTQYLVPAPLKGSVTADVQAAAVRAHRALGCRGFSRVDLVLTADRGPVVLEVNTIPGLTATSLLPKAAAAAGLMFPALCERLLASALGRGSAVAKEEECVHGST